MTRSTRYLNSLRLSAPWLTLAVLLAMSLTFPNRAESGTEAEYRKAVIATAMNDIPLFIGRWVGESNNGQVPREAQQLLRPNAIFSRTYQSPGGPSVHVLIVHCGDARDMIGHYPPICYPSSGWVQMPLDTHEQELTLNVRETKFPVRHYRFRLLRDQGHEEIIRIFNTFVLPDGTVTHQIDDINRMSERLALSVQGVAQLQVITSSSVSRAEAVDSTEEILNGMSALFDVLDVHEGVDQ